MRDDSGNWMVLVERRDYQPEDSPTACERHDFRVQRMAPTAPHLAELSLRRVAPGDVDEFFAAFFRGFHEDLTPELWTTLPPPSSRGGDFGIAVDGRWVSTCGAYSRVMTVPGGAVPTAAVTVVAVRRPTGGAACSGR